MDPVIKQKIFKLKKYADLMLPKLPDWVLEEHDGKDNPRCCTTLHLVASSETSYRWYEGEI